MAHRYSRLATLAFLTALPVLIGADGKGCSSPRLEPCASTTQCSAGEHCTTEDGACNAPPGCSDAGACPAVCYGVCTSASCAPQDARYSSAPGCSPSRTAYVWDGRACASTQGCTCVGSDCGSEYPDLESCVADHAGCPGYDCSRDPRLTLADYLGQHKTCASDADCTTVSTSACFNPCPNYVNTSVDRERVSYLSRQVKYCRLGDPGVHLDCAAGCPNPPPVACVSGVCSARP